MLIYCFSYINCPCGVVWLAYFVSLSINLINLKKMKSKREKELLENIEKLKAENWEKREIIVALLFGSVTITLAYIWLFYATVILEH